MNFIKNDYKNEITIREINIIKTSGIKNISPFFASFTEKNIVIKNLVNVLLNEAVIMPIAAFFKARVLVLSSPKDKVMASTSVNPDMNDTTYIPVFPKNLFEYSTTA